MKKNEDSMKQKIKRILGEMNIFLGSVEAQRRKDGLILEIDKLFDFIHVGLPVVASSMVEVKRVVEDSGVGVVIENVTSEDIAAGVSKILTNPREFWFDKCMTARENLHWGIDSFLITEHLGD